jgi:hypothetical protein
MRVIDTLLKQSATTALSESQFGHGKGYYADIESQKFPRIWIYDTFPTINIGKHGGIGSVTYSVLGGVQLNKMIDDSTDELVNALGECQAILMQYIHSISQSDEVVEMGRVKCEENWHLSANNVQEVSFAVDITVNESFTPIC